MARRPRNDPNQLDDAALVRELREYAAFQYEVRGEHDHNPPDEQDGDCDCGEDGCPNDPQRRMRWAVLALASMLEDADPIVREAARVAFEGACKEDLARIALEDDEDGDGDDE